MGGVETIRSGEGAGTVGNSCAFAPAETADWAYTSELVHRFTFKTVQILETATLQWVPWWNNQHLHQHLG
jgi:hypothetical protein